MIEIYTDGALRRQNQLIGAWCCLVLLPTNTILKAKVCSDYTITNNRMELTAVIEALQLCSVNSNITLYTDSQYVVFGIHNGNKKTNTDLWQKYSQVITQRQLHLTVKHVYGHQDNQGNNIVDLTMRHMLNQIIKNKLMQ